MLNFRKNEKDELELLHSEFASQLGPQMLNYLQERNSIPAFLSAVTLGLFDQVHPPPPPVNDENAMSTPARMM